MDKGAHFHACDLQVHTPRDRQWVGQGAVTVEDRRTFAAELIAACRERGLQGIAITDHHELMMFRFIREAAKGEVDANGDPIPEAEQVAVFPGMELTLGVPCQALLILDADFPEEWISLVHGALGLNPSPDTDATGAQVERIARITTLSQLYEELDRQPVLRGRYVVLPNVSEGGPSTLLRNGQAGKYKEMPCVGGYLDGAITQLGDGNKNILAGRASQYGNRALGLFQTSDCRRRDYSTLGTHRSWVKWAVPTAEAIRQACLARESRISQVAPQLPGGHITALSIGNSRFLGPQHVELNPQYNAFIGGRGTGKSTLLEYLRWGLCDDPGVGDGDSPYDYGNGRHKLIVDTLESLQATVTVTFSLNGVLHVVRRNAADWTVALKIGGGDFAPATPEQVRALLPLQAYSQKQLSQVSVRLDELRRFLEAPVRERLAELNREEENASGALRESRARVIRLRQLRRRAGSLETEVQSATSQVERLRSSLGGLSADDRTVIEAQSGYERADRIVTIWRNDIDSLNTAVAEFGRVLRERLPVAEDRLSGLPEEAVLVSMREAVEATVGRLHDLQRGAEREAGSVDDPASPLHLPFLNYSRAREAFRLRYEEAKQRSTSHQQTLQELAALEARLASLASQLEEVRGQISSLADAETEYTNARSMWRHVASQRTAVLEAQCRELTALSSGAIRARLRQGGRSTVFMEKVRTLTAGSGARGDRFERLRDTLRDGTDVRAIADEIVRDFESLLESKDLGVSDLPSTARLSAAGFTSTELTRARDRMTEDAWLDLALAGLDDVPEFEYRVREAQYIPFASASAGQQATALLRTLLNQPGPPLVIDQPEDDLDNEVMPEIARSLWEAKRRRQLIFASHNANLVVNGDAELVVCCGYRVAGEQSSGDIVAEGAIDMKDVRDKIASVMEGGKEAFDLRRAKYGF